MADDKLTKEEEEKLYTEQQVFRRPYEDEQIPISSDQQLGQYLLKVFAFISDPPIIEERIIRKKVPIIERKVVKDENGEEITVEAITGWETKEWEVPIVKPPKYHPLITGDIASAFLNDTDLDLYRDSFAYCSGLISFAKRYDIDLSLHHNSMADEAIALVVSSGAHKGKRAQLAKTNIIESTYKQNIYQEMAARAGKEKKGLLGGLVP